MRERIRKKKKKRFFRYVRLWNRTNLTDYVSIAGRTLHSDHRSIFRTEGCDNNQTAQKKYKRRKNCLPAAQESGGSTFKKTTTRKQNVCPEEPQVRKSPLFFLIFIFFLLTIFKVWREMEPQSLYAKVDKLLLQLCGQATYL